GEGKKIISADYSQIELRLIAEISGEDNMIKAFLRGQQIRGAFVSGEGKKIISADYSQIELRLIAEISGEDNMIKAF
ncbi:DNA polymerase, partial [Chryseobacterium sp. CH1]|uniref:DNA polymerase n=1 Tax=Chryseobacterium sp. CH1 TaxID=713551 RepID=UPI0013E8FB8B